jgi:GTP cyclohydrolase I
VNRADAARAVEQFLLALGHSPTGELAHTGELVAEAWCSELLSGQGLDPGAILREGAIEAAGVGPVLLRDLVVTTMCPHHLMPAHGRGDVLYLPGGKVAGLGAIARALIATTRKLTLQERAGSELADALCDALGARAAAVRLRLTHTCLVARGARESAAVVETLSFAGAFAADGNKEDRALALAMLR